MRGKAHLERRNAPKDAREQPLHQVGLALLRVALKVVQHALQVGIALAHKVERVERFVAAPAQALRQLALALERAHGEKARVEHVRARDARVDHGEGKGVHNEHRVALFSLRLAVHGRGEVAQQACGRGAKK